MNNLRRRVMSKDEEIDYSLMPFTIEVVGPGEFWIGGGNGTQHFIATSFSPDGTQQSTAELDYNTVYYYNLNNESVIGTRFLFWRKAGESINNVVSSSSYMFRIGAYTKNKKIPTAKIKVYGNILSLIYPDFQSMELNNYSLGNNAFPYMFCPDYSTGSYNPSNTASFVVDASNLILPTTTITSQNCYKGMFSGNTGLLNTPELPATIVPQNGYYAMFAKCTSLTVAPELPATTLASQCYNAMFYNCTSLTTAPSVLPATTLVDSCYLYMFQGCTSLTTSPELPATTLANSCYNAMFYNCTSLNTITCLYEGTINNNSYTAGWCLNVSATGTFYKKSSATYLSGANGIPSGWTTVNI